MRELPTAALDLIKQCEGLRLTSYKCPAGVWTIGYGHTGNVQEGHTITEAQAEQLLLADLEESQEAVERLVRVEMTDGEYGAFVSFVFNIGAHAFEHSTLLRLFNGGQVEQCALEFPKWCHAGSVVLPGLVDRRKHEQEMFYGGYDHG